MESVIVSLDDLSACDPAAALAWKMAVAHMVKDLCDRDFDPSAREVRLTLKLKPIVGSISGKHEATGEFIITSKIPAEKTGAKTFRLQSKDGELLSVPTPNEDEPQAQLDYPRVGQQEEKGQ